MDVSALKWPLSALESEMAGLESRLALFSSLISRQREQTLLAEFVGTETEMISAGKKTPLCILTREIALGAEDATARLGVSARQGRKLPSRAVCKRL